ncbi:S9 family peptidase [Dactylosporangium sp. AC04546]|uniref:S9 family peptidase n=1 Tax=Dactylosporangium sp. AC04546 TaxID=2862460 RepID=UPI001EDD7F6C|nr:S9 family peptidase [Dactylosporangium sp. AC04546]WVK82214.1 S9 family peptidase [Dactylosporangium sp. AC04546]
MKPLDLSQMRLPGAPALSPDGTIAVVSLTRLDFGADQYTSQLWRIRTDGDEEPVQLTYGWHDSAPRISPDGSWLAFLRATKEKGSRAGGDKAEHDSAPQLCVMPLAGGEARRLTDLPLGAGAPAWSPDATRLAFSARVPQEGRYGTGKTGDGDKIGPDGEPPRRLTRLFSRVDGLGFLHDRPAHLFVAALDGTVTQLTEGERSHGDPRWSPDGEWLTFVSEQHDTWADDVAGDVCVIPAAGGELRVLTGTTLTPALPHFTPDGASVVFAGYPAGEGRVDPTVRHESLWSVPVAGGEVRQLLDNETYTLASPGGDIAVTDAGVLFTNEHRGAVQLLLVPFDGGAPEILVDGERQVAGFASAGETLVTTIAGPADWGEVYAGERRLTNFSAGFPVLEQAELTATAPDGYPVHGWVVRPEGEGPHPVLLMIHGGPFAQYGWRLFDEAQVYAGAGYAVVYGNPRGSSGYGEAHGRAVMGNVGEVSAVDLLALLDAALKAPDLDGSRVGVLGGSHGGFMTTWLAAHHGERFKAAVSERAVNAIDSFQGSSDIGWFFAESLYRTDFARQSPLTYADRIAIPMLIVHSEQDWRCPVEQAQRLFVALKRRGTPVEFLLFPGEGHELSRTGRPSHRVARFDAILDWFARHV